MGYPIINRKDNTVYTRDEILKTALENPYAAIVSLGGLTLFEFVQCFWNEVSDDELKINWHIPYLCGQLEEIAERVGKKEKKLYDLITNIPPGTTKTIICSVMFPVWCWTKWYWMKFITGSYSSDLSLESAEKSRDIIRSDKFKLLFPDIIIKEDKDTKSNYRIAFKIRDYKGKASRTVLGGGRYSTSVGGTIMGFHGHINIWDDPLNPKQAVSEALLKIANDWIDQSASTRKIDKEVSVTILVMQRLHQCLLPETRIYTPNGFKEIQNFKLDDVVYTSFGKQNVQGVFNREYDGNIISICPSGHPENIKVTETHQIYTQRGWVKAGDLNLKDILLYPITEHKESIVLSELWPEMPIKDKSPKIFRSNFNGDTKRVPYEVLKKLVDAGKSSTELAEYFGFKNRQIIDLYIAKYKIKRKAAVSISNEIINDLNFWRVVGYWLAEGCLVKGRRGISHVVRFSFGNKDKEMIADTVAILKKYKISVHVNDTKYNSFCVRFSSYQFALFLENNFGVGAGNKHLPDWIFSLPKEYFAQLLKGYWLGDGSIIRNSIRLTSVSLQLLTDIQNTLLSFNVISSIYASKPSYKCKIQTGPGKGRIIEGKLIPYELRATICDISSNFWGISENNTVKYKKLPINRINGKWMCVKINHLEVEKYKGLVYDITTPCHDFLSGLVMLHNSDPTGHLLEKIKEGKQIKHICLPGEIVNYRDKVSPLELIENYSEEGLLDPVRLSTAALKELEADLGQYGYAGQIGQSPTPPGGGMFKVDNFQIIDHLPNSSHLMQMMRYWDKAGTEGGGKRTAGVKIVKLTNGKYIVVDVRKGQWEAEKRERIIKQTAQADERDCEIGIEQEPGPIWEDEKVQMANGILKKLKDVKKGDFVINWKGKSTKVLEIYQQGTLPILKITTDSGREIHTAYNHPFLTPNGWVNADHLQIDDNLALKTDIQIKITSFPSIEECRLAGYFVGDGCCTWTKNKEITCNSNIVCSDVLEGKDIIYCAEKLGFKVHVGGSKGWTYYISGGIKDWLKNRGLAGKNTFQKRIPEWVLKADNVCVANFLGAYLACDGSVMNTKHHPCVEYYSTNLDLLKDTQSTLLRFGIYTMLRKRNYKDEFQKTRHFCYRITTRRSDGSMGRFAKYIPVYGIKGEKLKIFNHLNFDQPYISDPIVSIEKMDKMLCRCIAVKDGESFLVNDVVVHNSGGKESAEATMRNLAGFVVHKDLPKGDKIYRADPFSVQVNEGNVMLLRGDWNHDFIEELRFFPFGNFKDQVDAASAAFNLLATKKIAGRIT